MAHLSILSLHLKKHFAEKDFKVLEKNVVTALQHIMTSTIQNAKVLGDLDGELDDFIPRTNNELNEYVESTFSSMSTEDEGNNYYDQMLLQLEEDNKAAVGELEEFGYVKAKLLSKALYRESEALKKNREETETEPFTKERQDSLIKTKHAGNFF